MKEFDDSFIPLDTMPAFCGQINRQTGGIGKISPAACHAR